MFLFSVKMRASRNTEDGEEHISGAERIVRAEE
ncbi:6-carboxyhexanoate--CoA ligase, partial [uncultured Desulfovibrio sp.]